mgnify:CR=1 FL=1
MFQDILAPVPASLLDSVREKDEPLLGNWLRVHDEIDGFPDWEDCQICIMGVLEARGSADFPQQADAPNAIRQHLYRLFPGDWHGLKVADIGNLYPGESRDDTFAALIDLLRDQLQRGILPIVLGGSHDLVYAMYRAYEYNDRTVNMASVDARFDLGKQEDGALNERNYLSHVILQKPYRLFNFANLGYQSYFNHPEERDLMERMHFDLVRLGELRSDIRLCEPIFRDTDLVSIDFSAMKSMMGGVVRHGPNGLTEEEVCALARYAGISDKLSSFGLFGLDAASPAASGMSLLAAQTVWYLIEGYCGRKGDFPLSDRGAYDRFAVLVEDSDDELIFYRSPLSGRWWMDVPVTLSETPDKKTMVMVPCTHDDYEQACNNEIPERWWKAYRKSV